MTKQLTCCLLLRFSVCTSHCITFRGARPQNLTKIIHHSSTDRGMCFKLSSDRGLCSIETHAVFSDFLHFQAGPVGFELVVVKRVWSTFESDACYMGRFKGDIRLPFQNNTLKSATLCSGQNCSDVLIPH